MYIISNQTASGGDYRIYKYSEEDNEWIQLPGSAVEIAIDKNNVLWVIDYNGILYNKYGDDDWQLILSNA